MDKAQPVNIIVPTKAIVQQLVLKVWKIPVHTVAAVVQQVNNVRTVHNIFDVVWIHVHKN
jgi:hypothetical protein